MVLSSLYSFDFQVAFLSAIATIGLGAVAWLHNRRSASHIIFIFFCIMVAAWDIANYVSLHASQEEALLWVRLTLFTAIPHSVLFFLFIHTFPNPRITLRPKYIYPIILVTFAALAVSLTPLLFSKVYFENGRPIPVVGPGMILVAGVIIGGVLLGGGFLWKRLRLPQSSVEKRQWRFIAVGFALMFFLLIVFNLLATIFFQNTSLIPLSPLFLLPFVLLTTYAIVRHGFLDIKLIATEILTGVIVVALFMQGLLAATPFVMGVQFVSGVFFAVFGILLARSVKREIQRRQEMERLKNELETAYAKLKEIDQAKTDFLSMASHQLRSPLTVVKLGIGALLDGTFGDLKDKRQFDALNKMLESANRLINLIGDYLNVSRIELGKMQYNFQLADISKLAKDIVEEYQPRADVKKLKLSFSASKAIPQVKFDDEKMRHVITNLVDNAIKYTLKGSIKVQCDKKDKEIVVSIKDTGLGLSVEDMQVVFQKFRRAQGGNLRRREGEPIEGSGLGLHVAKMFVEKHGGRIWAESEGRGKGSTFFFTLLLEGPPPLPPEEVGNGGKPVEQLH